MDDIIPPDDSSAGLDAFLAETLQGGEAAKEIDAIRIRMIGFMAERGIEIIDHEEALQRQHEMIEPHGEAMVASLKALMDLEEPLSDEDREKEVDRIVGAYTDIAVPFARDTTRKLEDTSWLNELAFYKYEEVDLSDPDLKKQLHARLLANGRSGEWIDLIDQEFDGYLLAEDEIFEAVAAAIVEEASTDRTADEEFQRRSSEVQELMQLNGIEIDTDELPADFVLRNLTFLYYCYKQDGITRIDQARTILNSARLDLSEWDAVLASLFD